jgi:RNA-binding protein YlmH
MAVKDMLKHFDDSDRIFAAHIMDLCDQVEQGRGNRCTSFCDIHQSSLVRQIGQAYDLCIKPDGGYADAERVLFLIAQTQWELPDSPIVPILLQTYAPVSHRDVLGSALGLGIKREAIGDIVKTKDGQVMFVKPPADRLILDELKRIGREAVRCTVLDRRDVSEPIRDYREIKGTVKSLRLDSVVSLCAGCSREKGKQLVEKELVTVDAVMRSDPAFSLPSSAILSIRGFGKFRVCCDGGVTAKGRYFITVNKYI